MFQSRSNLPHASEYNPAWLQYMRFPLTNPLPQFSIPSSPLPILKKKSSKAVVKGKSSKDNRVSRKHTPDRKKTPESRKSESRKSSERKKSSENKKSDGRKTPSSDGKKTPVLKKSRSLANNKAKVNRKHICNREIQDIIERYSENDHTDTEFNKKNFPATIPSVRRPPVVFSQGGAKNPKLLKIQMEKKKIIDEALNPLKPVKKIIPKESESKVYEPAITESEEIKFNVPINAVRDSPAATNLFSNMFRNAPSTDEDDKLSESTAEIIRGINQRIDAARQSLREEYGDDLFKEMKRNQMKIKKEIAQYMNKKTYRQKRDKVRRSSVDRSSAPRKDYSDNISDIPCPKESLKNSEGNFVVRVCQSENEEGVEVKDTKVEEEPSQVESKKDISGHNLEVCQLKEEEPPKPQIRRLPPTVFPFTNPYSEDETDKDLQDFRLKHLPVYEELEIVDQTKEVFTKYHLPIFQDLERKLDKLESEFIQSLHYVEKTSPGSSLGHYLARTSFEEIEEKEQKAFEVKKEENLENCFREIEQLMSVVAKKSDDKVKEQKEEASKDEQLSLLENLISSLMHKSSDESDQMAQQISEIVLKVKSAVSIPQTSVPIKKEASIHEVRELKDTQEPVPVEIKHVNDDTESIRQTNSHYETAESSMNAPLDGLDIKKTASITTTKMEMPEEEDEVYLDASEVSEMETDGSVKSEKNYFSDYVDRFLANELSHLDNEIEAIFGDDLNDILMISDDVMEKYLYFSDQQENEESKGNVVVETTTASPSKSQEIGKEVVPVVEDSKKVESPKTEAYLEEVISEEIYIEEITSMHENTSTTGATIAPSEETQDEGTPNKTLHPVYEISKDSELKKTSCDRIDTETSTKCDSLKKTSKKNSYSSLTKIDVANSLNQVISTNICMEITQVHYKEDYVDKISSTALIRLDDTIVEEEELVNVTKQVSEEVETRILVRSSEVKMEVSDKKLELEEKKEDDAFYSVTEDSVHNEPLPKITSVSKVKETEEKINEIVQPSTSKEPQNDVPEEEFRKLLEERLHAVCRSLSDFKEQITREKSMSNTKDAEKLNQELEKEETEAKINITPVTSTTKISEEILVSEKMDEKPPEATSEQPSCEENENDSSKCEMNLGISSEVSSENLDVTRDENTLPVSEKSEEVNKLSEITEESDNKILNMESETTIESQKLSLEDVTHEEIELSKKPKGISSSECSDLQKKDISTEGKKSGTSTSEIKVVGKALPVLPRSKIPKLKDVSLGESSEKSWKGDNSEKSETKKEYEDFLKKKLAFRGCFPGEEDSDKASSSDLFKKSYGGNRSFPSEDEFEKQKSYLDEFISNLNPVKEITNASPEPVQEQVVIETPSSRRLTSRRSSTLLQHTEEVVPFVDEDYLYISEPESSTSLPADDLILQTDVPKQKSKKSGRKNGSSKKKGSNDVEIVQIESMGNIITFVGIDDESKSAKEQSVDEITIDVTDDTNITDQEEFDELTSITVRESIANFLDFIVKEVERKKEEVTIKEMESLLRGAATPRTATGQKKLKKTSINRNSVGLLRAGLSFGSLASHDDVISLLTIAEHDEFSQAQEPADGPDVGEFDEIDGEDSSSTSTGDDNIVVNINNGGNDDDDDDSLEEPITSEVPELYIGLDVIVNGVEPQNELGGYLQDEQVERNVAVVEVLESEERNTETATESRSFSGAPTMRRRKENEVSIDNFDEMPSTSNAFKLQHRLLFAQKSLESDIEKSIQLIEALENERIQLSNQIDAQKSTSGLDNSDEINSIPNQVHSSNSVTIQTDLHINVNEEVEIRTMSQTSSWEPEESQTGVSYRIREQRNLWLLNQNYSIIGKCFSLGSCYLISTEILRCQVYYIPDALPIVYLERVPTEEQPQEKENEMVENVETTVEVPAEPSHAKYDKVLQLLEKTKEIEEELRVISKDMVKAGPSSNVVGKPPPSTSKEIVLTLSSKSDRKDTPKLCISTQRPEDLSSGNSEFETPLITLKIPEIYSNADLAERLKITVSKPHASQESTSVLVADSGPSNSFQITERIPVVQKESAGVKLKGLKDSKTLIKKSKTNPSRHVKFDTASPSVFWYPELRSRDTSTENKLSTTSISSSGSSVNHKVVTIKGEGFEERKETTQPLTCLVTEAVELGFRKLEELLGEDSWKERLNIGRYGDDVKAKKSCSNISIGNISISSGLSSSESDTSSSFSKKRVSSKQELVKKICKEIEMIQKRNKKFREATARAINITPPKKTESFRNRDKKIESTTTASDSTVGYTTSRILKTKPVSDSIAISIPLAEQDFNDTASSGTDISDDDFKSVSSHLDLEEEEVVEKEEPKKETPNTFPPPALPRYNIYNTYPSTSYISDIEPLKRALSNISEKVDDIRQRTTALDSMASSVCRHCGSTTLLCNDPPSYYIKKSLDYRQTIMQQMDCWKRKSMTGAFVRKAAQQCNKCSQHKQSTVERESRSAVSSSREDDFGTATSTTSFRSLLSDYVSGRNLDF